MIRAADSVRRTRFHNPRLSRVGVEVLALDHMRARAAGWLDLPERVEFHLLFWVQKGRVRHRVDFHDVTLEAGTVLFVRPGQVQQWFMREGVQGRLLLFASEALAPSVARAEIDTRLLGMDRWPAVTAPGREVFRDTLADVTRMDRDIRRYGGSETEAAIIRHALMALLLRLAHALASSREAGVRGREAEIHRLFAEALEAGFMQRHTVADYARRLGYSESTLARACLATVGTTAKEVIDRRVALEAKRLLVHSRAAVVHIANQLGFAEPSNFVKFFRRMEGTTPQAFRQQALGE